MMPDVSVRHHVRQETIFRLVAALTWINQIEVARSSALRGLPRQQPMFDQRHRNRRYVAGHAEIELRRQPWRRGLAAAVNASCGVGVAGNGIELYLGAGGP